MLFLLWLPLFFGLNAASVAGAQTGVEVGPPTLADGMSAVVAESASRRWKSVSFLENRGQWPSNVRFLARTGNMLVRAEDDALVLHVGDPCGDPALQVLVRLELVGAASGMKQPHGERVLQGRHHYLIGNDPAGWTRNVRGFSQVRYPCITDGVDLVLREERGDLEYDLEVEAGTDLSSVVVACQGLDRLELGADGSLLMHTELGTLRQSAPKSEVLLPDGKRREVSVHFRIVDDLHFGFESPGLDSRLDLRIDPGLVWATYLGSSGSLGASETPTSSAVDAVGNLTLTGWANGYDFPTTPGAMVALPPGGAVVFVTKLDPTGNLIYSSTIGAHGGGARGLALALDSLGRATVGGILFNGTLFVSDFPTTPGAFDTIMSSGNTSGFVLQLSDLGDNLVFSTFVEGSFNGSRVAALDVANSGASVVGGFTGSPAFPTTPGGFDTTYGQGQDGFVMRLDPTGSYVEWSTFLGGVNTDDVTALEVDASDQVTVVGLTGSPDFPLTHGTINQTVAPYGGSFIARLNAQGSALVWSTFLGGNSQGGTGTSSASALALEPNGGVVVVGSSTDSTFPTTPGALYAFHPAGSNTHSYVARVNSTGSNLLYSTMLSFAAVAHDVVVDASGVATVVGLDFNATMPTTPGAYDATHANGTDAFIARINPTGTRLYYSTMFGSPGIDEARTLALLGPHRVAVGGSAETGMPTTPGSFDQTFNGGLNDCFAAVLDLFLQGCRGYGRSTPACMGDLTTNVTRMPSSGASNFGFYCSGAPPSSTGWLLLGSESPLPTPIGGASIWLSVSHRIVRIPVQSNATGFVETTVPLTSAPSGTHFAAQYVFLNSASCPGTGPFSASHALIIDVQ